VYARVWGSGKKVYSLFRITVATTIYSKGSMNLYRQQPFASRGRRDFRWDVRFCVRQRDKYNPEDNRVLENPAATAQLIDAFFDEQESILDPPCYNFVALKEFLHQGDLQCLNIARPILALLDDRRDQPGGHGLMRDWDSEKYARLPPPGDSVERLTLDEGRLFTKLRENVWRRNGVECLSQLLTRRRGRHRILPGRGIQTTRREGFCKHIDKIDNLY